MARTPASAIAIDLGPDDLPLYARALKLIPEPLAEPPWINVHRFLASIGAAVPEVFAADAHARMLLVEDVGELPLFEAALHGDAGDLYRLAADELLVFIWKVRGGSTSGASRRGSHTMNGSFVGN